MSSPEAEQDALHLVKDMVSTAVREVVGSLAEELREEFSHHVDTRLRETNQRDETLWYSTDLSTLEGALGRYDSTYCGIGAHAQRTTVLYEAPRSQGGWPRGRTPSGDGSIRSPRSHSSRTLDLSASH